MGLTVLADRLIHIYIQVTYSVVLLHWTIFEVIYKLIIEDLQRALK
jgi:hypothetical protein